MVRAHDSGTPQLDNHVVITFPIISQSNSPPLFNNTEDVVLHFTENSTGPGEEQFIPRAYDRDIENELPGWEDQVVYYHMIGMWV